MVSHRPAKAFFPESWPDFVVAYALDIAGQRRISGSGDKAS